MRVVLDANIFVSGLIYGGKPRQAVEFALGGGCDAIVSEPILSELAGTLSRKFGWQRTRILAALEDIRQLSEVVDPGFVLTNCPDPDDDRILEAAVEGHADCIVSGDKHLLRMKSFRGIEILAVGEFLLRLEEFGTPL